MFVPPPVKFKRIEAFLTGHIQSISAHGLAALPDAIKDIAVKARRALISLDKYYVYAKDLTGGEEIPLVQPRVDDVEMEIVFLPISIEEYELLGEKGFDFRRHPKARSYHAQVGNGTIVFLGIKTGEIIYRSCISNYRNAVYAHIYPEKLDSKTTCYQGFNWTHPNYRKKGLYTWAQTVMFNFMKSHGYMQIVMLEPEDQVGPRKVQDRLGSKMLCESFAFRFLFIVNYRWNKPTL